MTRFLIAGVLITACGQSLLAEETFVTIHQVNGNAILISKDESGGRGQGRRGGGAMMGRGRPGGASSQQKIPVTLPTNVKMTSAMRERRTFEFRVMGELAGGLRHKVFRDMKAPLSARVVTENGRITEINVITSETDINQSNTDSSGNTVIAVRPKRPPMKQK